MTRETLGRQIVAAILLLTAVSACAPGRSIVRGNWPDGRIEGNSTRVVRRVPAPAPAPVEEWVAADPMSAMSAADLNRMGVLQTIHFGFDQASVTGLAQQSTLEANAKWLIDNPGARIIIEGHCDERGTRRYNLDLGQRRAEAARAALVAYGVDARRLEVVSYGEELPVRPESNEMAWQENRRADFIIVAVDS